LQRSASDATAERVRNGTDEIIDNTDTFGAHARATNHESDVLTER